MGMSRAYTKGLATELNAESQTPERIEIIGYEMNNLLSCFVLNQGLEAWPHAHMDGKFKSINIC